MSALDERIKAAEDKLKQLKVQQQRIDARKRAAETKRKRSDDTRRKILAGALILEMMEQDATTKTTMTNRLDAYLTRPDDRALFGLSGNPEPAPSSINLDLLNT